MLRASLLALGLCSLACGGNRAPVEDTPAKSATDDESSGDTSGTLQADADAGRMTSVSDAFVLANLPFTEPETLAKIRVLSTACFRAAEGESRDYELSLPSFRFTFDKRGTITKVKVLCSTLPKKLTACLTDVFVGFELPTAASQSVDVGPDCPGKKKQ